MLNGLHFLTHIGLGWILANVLPGSRKDRWLIVLAGVLPDLDGTGILWSRTAYEATHRAMGHSLLFGLLLVAIAIVRGDAPWRTAALTAISFHLHLVLDVVGTGGLPIRYFWPLSDWGWSYRGHWVLASWQNGLVMAATLAGVVWIAWRNAAAPRATSVMRP